MHEIGTGVLALAGMTTVSGAATGCGIEAERRLPVTTEDDDAGTEAGIESIGLCSWTSASRGTEETPRSLRMISEATCALRSGRRQVDGRLRAVTPGGVRRTGLKR